MRFHGRVRNGVGWGPHAVITRSSQASKTRGQRTEGAGADSGSAHPLFATGVVKLSGMGSEIRDQRSVVRRRRPLGRSFLISDLCSLISGAKPQARDARLGLSVGSLVRAIRTAQLHALPRFHLRPIDVVVDHGSSVRPGLEEGFPLRCLQRLSRPNVATRRCGWRHNRSTRGSSTPVLSY